MTKLYLTLEDDDGQKVERVIKIDTEDYEIENKVGEIVTSMLNSLERSKKSL